MESDLLAFTAQLWPFAWTEEVPPVTSIAGGLNCPLGLIEVYGLSIILWLFG